MQEAAGRMNWFVLFLRREIDRKRSGDVCMWTCSWFDWPGNRTAGNWTLFRSWRSRFYPSAPLHVVVVIVVSSRRSFLFSLVQDIVIFKRLFMLGCCVSVVGSSVDDTSYRRCAKSFSFLSIRVWHVFYYCLFNTKKPRLYSHLYFFYFSLSRHSFMYIHS